MRRTHIPRKTVLTADQEDKKLTEAVEEFVEYLENNKGYGVTFHVRFVVVKKDSKPYDRLLLAKGPKEEMIKSLESLIERAKEEKDDFIKW
jgi:hypothetical protein